MAASREHALVALLFTSLGIGCAGAGTGVVLSVREPPLGEQGQLVQSLGVAAAGGSVAAVLPNGCVLPCDGTFNVRTTRKDQKRITLSFYSMAGQAKPIGGVQIVGLPPGAAGERGAAVKVRATKDKLIVSAEEMETGAALELRTLLHVAP